MMEERYPERKLNEMVEYAGRVQSEASTPVINPVHDWTSHFRTSLEYYAVNEPRRKRLGTQGKVGGKSLIQRLKRR